MKTKIKNISLLLVICMAISLSGCKKMGIKKRLRIDIDVHFKNNFVQLKLDDDLIFSDTTSTDNTIGFAESLTFNYPIGRYKLTVTVDGHEKSLKFRHKTKGTFIAISYSEPEIKITFPAQEYYYD